MLLNMDKLESLDTESFRLSERVHYPESTREDKSLGVFGFAVNPNGKVVNDLDEILATGLSSCSDVNIDIGGFRGAREPVESLNGVDVEGGEFLRNILASIIPVVSWYLLGRLGFICLLISI